MLSNQFIEINNNPIMGSNTPDLTFLPGTYLYELDDAVGKHISIYQNDSIDLDMFNDTNPLSSNYFI